mmetsp:Transcript_3294/g.4544  ORF Transcript_3294/g.4544 Transcript_3294/m.4544 type:complete len:264 (-) Transcript_3294:209-1000(-)
MDLKGPGRRVAQPLGHLALVAVGDVAGEVLPLQRQPTAIESALSAGLPHHSFHSLSRLLFCPSLPAVLEPPAVRVKERVGQEVQRAQVTLVGCERQVEHTLRRAHGSSHSLLVHHGQRKQRLRAVSLCGPEEIFPGQRVVGLGGVVAEVVAHGVQGHVERLTGIGGSHKVAERGLRIAGKTGLAVLQEHADVVQTLRVAQVGRPLEPGPRDLLVRLQSAQTPEVALAQRRHGRRVACRRVRLAQLMQLVRLATVALWLPRAVP